MRQFFRRRWLLLVLALFVALTTFFLLKIRPATKTGGQQPAEPFRIAGNFYYVGANDVAAFLITGPNGHIVIDGGYPSTATMIKASIARLGFDIKDVKVLLNSEPHPDHAGGLAVLQRASGAAIWASPPSAHSIASGGDDPDMMAPDHHGADLRRRGTAVVTPVPGEVELRPAAELGPHPPPAPLARPRTDAAEAAAGQAREAWLAVGRADASLLCAGPVGRPGNARAPRRVAARACAAPDGRPYTHAALRACTAIAAPRMPRAGCFARRLGSRPVNAVLTVGPAFDRRLALIPARVGGGRGDDQSDQCRHGNQELVHVLPRTGLLQCG